MFRIEWTRLGAAGWKSLVAIALVALASCGGGGGGGGCSGTIVYDSYGYSGQNTDGEVGVAMTLELAAHVDRKSVV